MPQIQINSVNGNSEESHSVKAGGIGDMFGKKSDKVVEFLIPAGYRRSHFSHEVNKGGIHAGGWARWKSDNSHDGRIRFHAWCDARSRCTVRVWGVMAVREQGFIKFKNYRRLY